MRLPVAGETFPFPIDFNFLFLDFEVEEDDSYAELFLVCFRDFFDFFVIIIRSSRQIQKILSSDGGDATMDIGDKRKPFRMNICFCCWMAMGAIAWCCWRDVSIQDSPRSARKPSFTNAHLHIIIPSNLAERPSLFHPTKGYSTVSIYFTIGT